MSLDKMPEDRLFQNNTKEDVLRWFDQLQYFHYTRSRGGHNCEGDSFCVYFKYTDRTDLESKLNQLGIKLSLLQEGDISFNPSKSYSFDELDKLKITISRFNDLEQPQHSTINGCNVHVWVLDNIFEISVSGTKEGNTYKVAEEDFIVCRSIEGLFDKLEWRELVDEEIKKHPHCISEVVYPELFL